MGYTKFPNDKKFILLSLGKDERLPSLPSSTNCGYHS